MNTNAPTPSVMQDEPDALRPGTRLDEFEVVRVLGVGGFGIVYLAMDAALERQVAIKEYMPSTLAARGEGAQVSVRSASHLETFGIGLRSFMNEAKLLARFDNPSLVKVYRFWEANGTAYMVMPFYPGHTLKEERRLMAQPPADEWIRHLIEPLLGALDLLHGEEVYHRDIAPDNILVLPDGPPVLLDFGAARSVISGRAQTLTAILKPSFAPIEQYADVSHLRQGPWTDLYALGAVMYYTVTGRPPGPSAARAVHDELQPLSAPGGPYAQALSASLLRAIDWALCVHPHDRPQSVQQMRDALAGRIVPPERPAVDLSMAPTVPAERVNTAWAPTALETSRAGPPNQAAPEDFAGGYERTDIDDASWPALADRDDPPPPPQSDVVAPSTARSMRRRVGWLLLGTLIATVGAVSWLAGARQTQEPALPEMAPAASAVVVAEPAAASAPLMLPEPVPVAVSAVPAMPTQKASAPRKQTRRIARTAEASPRQLCESRLFTMACMRRECEKPRFHSHPQCQKLRREDQARSPG